MTISKRPDAMTFIQYPTRMSTELAEFLAMIVAEGYFGERGALSFTQKSPEILSRFLTLTALLFGVTPSIKRQAGRVPFARIQNVLLQAYLEALGVSWGRSASKFVPECILSAPEECVKCFVSTLIGLEGNVYRASRSKASFDLTMASRILIDQLHVLLLNFGIVATKREKWSMATNGLRVKRQYYRLCVTGRSNIEALSNLGVYEYRKQHLLIDGNLSDATARDWIPQARRHIQGFMREMQRAGFPLKSTLDHSQWRMARAIAGGNKTGVRELTYAFAKRLTSYAEELGFSGESTNWIKDRISEGYAYDPVVCIQTEGTNPLPVHLSDFCLCLTR